MGRPSLSKSVKSLISEHLQSLEQALLYEYIISVPLVYFYLPVVHESEG